MLALTGPLDVFASNRDELGFAAKDFFPLCVACAAVSALLLFLLLFLIPDGGFRIVFPVYLALSLSAAILPFFNRLSSLPGDRLSQASVFQTVAGIAIPVLLLVAAVFCFLFVGRADLLTTGSAFVLIPLLLSAVVSFVSIPLQNPDVFKEPSNPERRLGTITNVGISDLGSDGTVLYLCIDRLDESFCRKAEELDPTIFDPLDGFTRYVDHVSLYSNTYPAVSYMLTGHEADFSRSRKENLRLGYGSPRLLGAIRDAGYSIGIYADGYYCFGTAANVADYADNLIADGCIEVERKTALSGEMLSLSLFRSSPSVLTPLYAALSTETLTGHLVYVPGEQGEPEYNSNNDAVKDELDRRGFPVIDGKRFLYVHVVGMHAVLDAENSPNWTLSVLKECFSIVNAYLDVLRDAGLYRDATIVITGDHPSPLSDYNPVGEPRMTALFVKRRGDAGTPLKVSTAQVSQGQIASEILDSVGIPLTDGDPLPLSRTPEGVDAVRFHNFSARTSKGMRVETYRITGPAADFSNWTAVKTVGYSKRLED
ncbi:MAG: hypothetical protein J5958_04810 [Clostridia bacterium]|nr:hypothetical protein [Clostridia bacterium]